ncbi:MAG: chemotaxis protein CheB [Geminicoccaceae bacterium]
MPAVPHENLSQTRAYRSDAAHQEISRWNGTSGRRRRSAIGALEPGGNRETMTLSIIQPDTIVIGGSAGAVEAMRALARLLPEDLPAAVFVAIHRGHEQPTYLPDILDAAGPLPAVRAEEGMKIVASRSYVAPPDRHLLVGVGHLHVRRGPRENRCRPAIDPLFRSAAVAVTSRVIGVLLSGTLDDGTAGLLAIKRCGGTSVVQDPRHSSYGGMAESAIRAGAVDHVCLLAQIPALLSRLVTLPASPAPEPPDDLRMEALIAAQELRMHPNDNRLGTLSPLTCPDCHGTLHEIDDEGFLRFRCHTGHAFSAESLRDAQAEAWERALYDALRAQEEQLALLRRMTEDAYFRGHADSARSFEARARSYEEGVQIIRGLLRPNGPGPIDSGVQD